MLPHIDPNIVLWANLVSDLFTVLASGSAAYFAFRMYIHKVGDELKHLEDKIKP